MASTPQFAANPRSPQINIVNSNGTALQTVFTVGSTGAILRGLWATSNDTTARWATLYKSDGTVDSAVLSLKFAAASVAVPYRAVNFLDPSKLTKLDPFEIQWHLAAGHVFKVGMETAVGSGFTVSVFAEYGEF